MDLDHLKKLVDACHDEAERTNDTVVSGAELDAYLCTVEPARALAAQIRRLESERDEARARNRENGTIIAAVNEAVGRAGIHCAVTLWEAVDQIAAERNAAGGALARIGEVLAANGCDCDESPEDLASVTDEHCLGHQIEAAWRVSHPRKETTP